MPSGARPLLWLAAGGLVAPLLPFATGIGWLGAPLAGTCAFLALRDLAGGPRRHAVFALLAWAALLSATTIACVRAADPARAAAAVPHGTAYWDEMRPYLLTGVGKESTPSRFVPEHVLHLAGFATLALATGGWAGAVLGAWLVGYMSFYVAEASLLAAHPLLAALLAWHPWALVRVAAFVLLGVCLARRMLLGGGWAAWWTAERRSVGLGIGLWALDLALKASCAPAWSALLRRAAGIA